MTMTDLLSRTQVLIDRAHGGDEAARQQLLEHYRDYLRRMVAVRLDRRLAARVDVSDVVQATLVEAARRLDDYLRERPLPFYGWLRQLAGERIVDTHRRHVTAQRRSVTLERRRTGKSLAVRAHADRSACRLHGRWHALESRGKPRTIVVVAVARELAGHCWALATME